MVDGIERRGGLSDAPRHLLQPATRRHGLAYGEPAAGLSVGAGIKVLDLSIDSVHARATALDAGSLRRKAAQPGGVVRAIWEEELRFGCASHPLPVPGLSWVAVFPAEGWTASAELRFPRETTPASPWAGTARRLAGGRPGAVRAGPTMTRTARPGSGPAGQRAPVLTVGRLDLDFAGRRMETWARPSDTRLP